MDSDFLTMPVSPECPKCVGVLRETGRAEGTLTSNKIKTFLFFKWKSIGKEIPIKYISLKCDKCGSKFHLSEDNL